VLKGKMAAEKESACFPAFKKEAGNEEKAFFDD